MSRREFCPGHGQPEKGPCKIFFVLLWKKKGVFLISLLQWNGVKRKHSDAVAHTEYFMSWSSVLPKNSLSEKLKEDKKSVSAILHKTL